MQILVFFLRGGPLNPLPGGSAARTPAALECANEKGNLWYIGIYRQKKVFLYRRAQDVRELLQLEFIG